MPDRVLFCSDTFRDTWGASVTAIDPTVGLVALAGTDPVADDDIQRITEAFFSADLWPARAARFFGVCLQAPNLRWLQSMSAGTDSPVFARLQQRGVTVTNSSGAAAPSIAETVVLYLLALGRDLPRLVRAQSDRRWEPAPTRDLHGMRLGILGMGAIGGEVARLATAFGMDVVGLRRSPRGDEPCPTWPISRFGEVLARSDAIVVAAPLTDETRGLFDAAAFAGMRPGSWFVNVGRGEIVDETALISALESGQLGGAALDVFATEPLPDDSPLWNLPNVIVTPHSSGSTDRTERRAVDLFLDNFRRRTDGAALRNAI